MCVNNVSPDLSINTPVPGRSQGLLENVQRLHKPHRGYTDQRATKTSLKESSGKISREISQSLNIPSDQIKSDLVRGTNGSKALGATAAICENGDLRMVSN